MYLYETHLHTCPVSRCAGATPEESVQYYKSIGYAGIFVTNHFIDGNINVDRSLPYEERIRFYFSDYEKALEVGRDIGLSVFAGVEMTYGGTDFLVYGLDKAWYLAHLQIMEMKKTEELALMMENGALVIQAHPFREATYIDHLRLFPRSVHGVEVINGCRTDFENKMAKLYAEQYGLLEFAGTDNHRGGEQMVLAGMCAESPIADEQDFVERVKVGQMQVFSFTQEPGSKS